MKTIEIAIDLLKKLDNLGIEAYIVGGLVRDTLLEYETNDIDIAVKNSFDDLVKKLEGEFDLNLSFQKFFSLRLQYKGCLVEVTSFRTDGEYYDNRHSVVKETNSMEVDSKRRDFTINAMYFDKNLKLYDFNNGEIDLKEKIIKTVKDVSLSFSEDPLRALRAIKYSSRYSFLLDNKLEEELEKVTLLNIKSKIKKELDEILNNSTDFHYLCKITYFQKYNNAFSLFKKCQINLIDKYVIMNYYSELDLEFTKIEKRYINKVTSLLISDDYNMFNNITLLENVNNIKKLLGLKEYDLVIKTFEDVNISIEEIIDIFNINKISKYKELLIKKILSRELNNNYVDIVSYLESLK